MSNEQSDALMSEISEIFSPLEVSRDSTFADLGATSVSLLRLMVSTQTKFNVDIDVVDMFTVDTVGEFISLVEERIPQTEITTK
ncbi:acyl carrier protein [Streptomyces sp. NPDC001904]|uniref:acyl carrier protein n=1 Tax=Streptomyces sp. NPDC001904 TaxID=3154531 RepID=UPI00331B01DD